MTGKNVGESSQGLFCVTVIVFAWRYYGKPLSEYLEFQVDTTQT